MSEKPKFAGWIGGYPRDDSNYPTAPTEKPEVKISIVPTLGGALVAISRDNREPKITFIKPHNQVNHNHNISIFTGWNHGKYFKDGVAQKPKPK